MALIELQHVNKIYQLGNISVRALDDVSVSIEPGEYVAIMGPSGSGKSTLMHIIGCLDQPTSGTYRFGGDEVSSLPRSGLVKIRRERIGFIFQNFNLLPRLTAAQNVELPLVYRGVGNRRAKALEMLERVGLHHRAGHRPTELSGGEQQRVAVARALVNDPALILADEPTGNLDSKTGAEIVALFGELHRQGRTIVMVSHDQAVAAHALRRVSIHDGRIV